MRNTQRPSSVKVRAGYAKKYYSVLVSGNAQKILTLPRPTQLQIMKSLSVLSKFLGWYDRWKEIKENYQLKWSDDNSLATFQDLVNDNTTYNRMMLWLKTSLKTIPSEYGAILIYSSLTGLRPEETCQSISLIKQDLNNYLNKEKMIIEHFKFPYIFLRKTKHAYVSIISKSIIKLAEQSGRYNYNTIRCYLKRRKIPMHMNYCRKIFATYLRQKGIEQEIIDLLQGRIPKSIFVRHYYRPDLKRFDEIRVLLDDLYDEIKINH